MEYLTDSEESSHSSSLDLSESQNYILPPSLEDQHIAVELAELLLAADFEFTNMSQQQRREANRPKPFSGHLSQNVDMFISQIRIYFMATSGNNDEEHKVATFATYLEDEAFMWFQQYLLKHGGDMSSITFDSLCDALRLRFLRSNLAKSARSRLDTLRQTHSVRAYTSIFNKIKMDVPMMTEEEQEHFYLKGLQPDIKKQIEQKLVLESLSMDQIINLAERLDDIDHGSIPDKKKFSRYPNSRKNERTYGTREDEDEVHTNKKEDEIVYMDLNTTSIRKQNSRKLAPEELALYRKLGLCFNCDQRGHCKDKCKVGKE